MNEGLQRPASFSLDGWEQIWRKLAQWPADRPMFCTHVHLKNAFWSCTLPRQHGRGFRFHLRWQGDNRILCMSRMPFSGKYSPLFCRTALRCIVRPLIPDDYLLFHYLDDFLILGPDSVRLRVIAVRVMGAWEEPRFLLSAKSTIEPVTEVFFLRSIHKFGCVHAEVQPNGFSTDV